MRFLRTNTAVVITVGPFFDKTDGVTPETALTATNEKITFAADTDDNSVPTLILDITGAGSATSNDFVHITGDDAGYYSMEIAAANVNRLGRMSLAITDAANHCPVFHEFMVLPAVVYDAMVLGTDLFDVSVTQWLGTAASTPTVAGVPNVNAKTWNDLTTVALPLIPTVAGRTLDVAAGGEAGVDFSNINGTLDAAEIGADAITAAKIADGAIDAATFAAGAINAAAIAADAIGASELAADAVTEIAAPILAVLGALNDAAADGDPTTTDTMVAYLKQIINTLEGSAGLPTWPAAAAPANAVSIAEAVRSIYTQIGVAGAGLTAADDAVIAILGSPAGASMSADIAAVKTETAEIDAIVDLLPDAGALTTIQSDLDNLQTRVPAALVGGRMDSSVGAMANNVVTAAAIATDAIGSDEIAATAVTEIQSGLSTLDAAGIRTAVGLASANLDTQLSTIDDFLDTEVAAIKAKTDNLPSDPADQSAVEAAITATWTTAMTEAYAADGATATPAQALYMILAFLAERSVSGTTVTVKKLDGATTAMTFTINSATTPTSITRAT